jgi:hypothetical protein
MASSGRCYWHRVRTEIELGNQKSLLGLFELPPTEVASCILAQAMTRLVARSQLMGGHVASLGGNKWKRRQPGGFASSSGRSGALAAFPEADRPLSRYHRAASFDCLAP